MPGTSLKQKVLKWTLYKETQPKSKNIDSAAPPSPLPIEAKTLEMHLL